MLSSYVSSKILECLYPGRLLNRNIKGGRPYMIASKMIPGFVTLIEMRSKCDVEHNTICNKPVRGHEEVNSLIDFLGLQDYHSGI